MPYPLILQAMNNRNKTLVLGASDNPSRYSYIARNLLVKLGHQVVAIGRSKTMVDKIPVETDLIPFADIDTVTLYIAEQHQKPYYDYILSLRPRRVIFNPGTENEELKKLLENNGIATLEACTLVMLQTGQY